MDGIVLQWQWWNTEQVAQRGAGCSIPGNIQDHTGQGSEQPDLVEAVPLTREGLYQVTFTSSFQTNHVMILYSTSDVLMCAYSCAVHS